MASSSSRSRAIALYKELHRLGRDYPDPACVTLPLLIVVTRVLTARTSRYNFHSRLRGLFESA